MPLRLQHTLLQGRNAARHDGDTDGQHSKKMIWQEGDTMYYPEGVTDPDYCVLKFTAFAGRYYSGFKSEDFTIE